MCLLISCTKKEDDITLEPTPPSNALEWQIGKNEYNVDIDGARRNFLIHVPSSYDAQASTPMVFMLHGTGGDGEKLLNPCQIVFQT